jgi:sporulation protein YtfJ
VSDHPIENLMKTAMESIREMVDVNTVVGDPVETPDGSIIIPISRVSTGFAAGGGEFEPSGGNKSENSSYPFGGGSGAGVSVRPVGFLVSSGREVRLLPVEGNAALDHLIDAAPRLLNQIRSILKGEGISNDATYTNDNPYTTPN